MKEFIALFEYTVKNVVKLKADNIEQAAELLQWNRIRRDLVPEGCEIIEELTPSRYIRAAEYNPEKGIEGSIERIVSDDDDFYLDF